MQTDCSKTTTSYCVYWLHLEKQTDPYTEGYIGSTNNPIRRWYQHREKGNVIKKVKEAISLYGKDNIIFTILQDNLNRDDALALERKYRNKKDTGWNIGYGGHNVNCINEHEVTLFHKDNPDIEYHFSTITEASKVLGINRLTIHDSIRRANNSYARNGWHVVNKNTNKETIQDYKELIRNFQKTRDRSKDKKITKKVQLVHISNPNTVYTFDSFTIALKELNLKRSSLEHKLTRHQKTPNKLGWSIWYLDSPDLSNEEIKH